MNHDEARASIDGLFSGDPASREPLRRHLEGCAECRAYFDRTARAFRLLAGKPDEMTPEELAFFAPPLPAATVTRLRWPVLGAVLAAAAAVTVVVWSTPSEFTARGTTTTQEAQTTVRALCSHVADAGVVISERCAEGDRLGFVASPGLRRFVAVALVDGTGAVEVVLSGAEGVLGAEEAVLAQSASWRPGVKVVALSSKVVITEELAERCARGECPDSVQRQELTP